MKSHSENTCAIFSYLPRPPTEIDRDEAYIQSVEALSCGLPPIVLMNAVESVATSVEEAI